VKYLVLGSEGQIGKFLTSYIRDCGHEAIEYDVRHDPMEDLRLFGKHRNAKHKILNERIKEADFIFFLAWDVGGSKYLSRAENSFHFLQNNIALMQNTFFFINKYNKPFIFTSSQMSSMVHSVYGNTKLIGERYTKLLGGICVKLWNVYGPEKIDERSHVITDFVHMAKNKNNIVMRTSGEELRQFLYVGDCCEALMIISKEYNKISRDKEIHISSFAWISIEEIARIISNMYNCTYTKGNLKDDVQMAIQIEPDPFILNYWKPKFSLKSGIERFIKDIESY